ncbi:MAG: hypothetical protein RMK02_05735 [Burkholderiales bacterium]|nr:hypothetical protein [Burkholderiales bacterium]
MQARVALAPSMAAAKRDLQAGVGAITTGCAFLARRQRALAQAVAVPLAARSLGLPPAQGATLGGEGRTAWG